MRGVRSRAQGLLEERQLGCCRMISVPPLWPCQERAGCGEGLWLDPRDPKPQPGSAAPGGES